MNVYDYRTIGFVAGNTPVPITATVPDVMVGVIISARYAIGNQSDPVTAFLLQGRLGTITGTLDVVTLNSVFTTIPIVEGKLEGIVAVVDPGHQVFARAEGGTVVGKIIFGYSYGRVRRP
ncbi:MAG: hypothetical protein NZ957_02430 [Thaumarchaeota archaeon]|nr:hypothetical protein [Candidatus Calditenuaceae archaeon]